MKINKEGLDLTQEEFVILLIAIALMVIWS